MKKFIFNVYVKNAFFALLGLVAILICKLVKTIPQGVAGYIIFIALLFVARGVGKIINELALSAYRRKNNVAATGAKATAVRNKSVTSALIIVLVLLALVTMKPALFGNPSNAIIFFCAFFFWHIIHIPVYIYCDKHYEMQLKRPR